MSMYEYIVFLKICLFERFAIILCNRFLLDICWTKNHTIHAACTAVSEETTDGTDFHEASGLVETKSGGLERWIA